MAPRLKDAPLPLEMLYGFGEVVDDVDGLGAHGLAGAALDALRSGPLGGLPRVEALDELVVFGSALQVQQVHGGYCQ